MMERIPNLLSIVGILGIVVLGVVALLHGQDGTLVGAAITAIGTLAGVHIARSGDRPPPSQPQGG